MSQQAVDKKGGLEGVRAKRVLAQHTLGLMTALIALQISLLSLPTTFHTAQTQLQH